MHHQITLGDFSGIRDELIGAAAAARRAGDALTKQILLGRHSDAFRNEAAFNPHHHKGDNISGQRARSFPILSRLRTHTIFAQQIAEPFSGTTRPGCQDGPALGLGFALHHGGIGREDILARAACFGEKRAGAPARSNAIRHGEGRKAQHAAIGQHRRPASLIQIKRRRRRGAIRHIALTNAGRHAAGFVMIGDHLKPRLQHFLGLMIKADFGTGQILQ